jgi:hypothetical protein
VTVDLPDPGGAHVWCRFGDTAAADAAIAPGSELPLLDQSRLVVRARSVVVLTALPLTVHTGGTA